MGISDAKSGVMNIKGRVWVFGDNIDTDQILPGYAMAEPFEVLGKFAMAGSRLPDFSKHTQPGDIIVAGKNFGCGSSREQAPAALKQVGVALVIAVSFARIFRRNAINIGLAVFQADISDQVKGGDMISVSLPTGLVTLNNTTIQGSPLTENVMATLRAGGLINRVRLELGRT